MHKRRSDALLRYHKVHEIAPVHHAESGFIISAGNMNYEEAISERNQLLREKASLENEIQAAKTSGRNTSAFGMRCDFVCHPVRCTKRIAWRIFWQIKRAEKRLAKRLIERLIARYHWHNTILDTNIPNVGCLRAKTLTVVNQYGQEHSHAWGTEDA